MGEDCGTWIPHMQFGWQSPNLSPLGAVKRNGVSEVTSPAVNTVLRNETVPPCASSALPQFQLGHTNEPHGWFYCLPRFRQEFTPAPNFTVGENLPPDHLAHFSYDIASAPFGESGSPQKQFLVIDQTAGQTTIVYGPRFGSPNECRASWHSKLHSANYLNGNGPSFRTYLNHMTEPVLADKVDENKGTDTESEMHEDTEEINALLYSDSDVYSTEDDDDEVTSTGHSPSTMTTHDNHEIFKKTTEEVASSIGNTKKRKLSDGYYDDMQLMDTASSLNQKITVAMENDAESRCSGCKGEGSGKMGFLSGNKKTRKEKKIRDVLSILQSIIPGGKDKDPVMVLGDAIDCLKSLKLKAKELGLDSL